MTYFISGLKKFRGHEGEPCFQGSLVKDGKRVGTWSDDSWGGGMLFYFKDKDIEKDFHAWANAQPAAVNFAAKMFAKWGEPKYPTSHADLVISDMVAALDEEKRFKNICKTKLMIRVSTDPEGQYRTFKVPYEPKHDAIIFQKFPNAEIVNKRFLQG